MSIEENNIQALLSLGSNINLQDKQGNSMLHVAINGYIDDQQNFGVYKEVIKEILQFGAKRDLKNEEGKTPYQLVELYRHDIQLQTRDDYIAHEVPFDYE